MQPEDLKAILPMVEAAAKAFRSEYKRLEDIRGKSPLFSQPIVNRGKRLAHMNQWSQIAPPGTLQADVIYRAAASDRGPESTLAFESTEGETLIVDFERVVKCLSHVMDPVAKNGQFLLLGSRSCDDKDLVACRTQDGEHYLGRMSRADGILAIAPINPVRPRETRCIAQTAAETLLPVVGILYETRGVKLKCRMEQTWEWGCVPGAATGLPREAVAIQAHGTCMEPIARDSQWVLVRKCDLSKLMDGDLCIVEKADGELYFKRLYKPEVSLVALISTNPVVPEAPLLITADSISRAFQVLGVIFEAEQSEELRL